MNGLLVLVCNNTSHSVPSNNFPIVYPCSDIENDSSALILLVIHVFIFPKYVVLKSEFSSNLVLYKII